MLALLRAEEERDRYRIERDFARDVSRSIGEERDRLLETVKLAYRKHCANDDSIGWEELGGILHTALCESLGDDGYCEWLKTLEGGSCE